MVNIVFLLLLFFFTASSIAAEFIAEVDRNQLNTDEHLLLTLSLTNSDTRLRAQGVSPNIDLSVLTTDFDLGTPDDKNHYNIFRNRGRSTSSLSITLFPKRTGTFTIPAFFIDDLKTAPIAIEVKTLPNAPLAFTQTEINQKKVWVGQQLVIHLDLFSRMPLDSAKLGSALETEPMPLELIEHIRLPRTDRTEEKNGFTYQVLRTTWVLHPMEAGSLAIHFPDAWLVAKTGKKLRLPQSKLTIDVQALPAGLPKNVFIGKPGVSITPIGTTHVENQISNWQYSLTAANHSSLIPVSLSFPASDNLKIYTGQGQLDRLEHKDFVEFKMNYILSVLPKAAGKATLPTLTLNYFDTESESLQTLTIPSPDFTVLAATHTQQIDTAISSEKVTQEKNEFAPKVFLWQISTVTLLLIWFSTLYYFMRTPKNKQTSDTPNPTSKTTNLHPHVAELTQAFGSRTLEEGLQQWEKINIPSIALRSLVKTIQAHYYAHSEKRSEDELKTKTTQAIEIIKAGKNNKNISIDRWSPEAFTAGKG
ncbi:hypothetical protein MNBD_GAMMA16-587 [hydrothermal vent metagenome]|uniref:BatD n=1 Tax=hydrothermal vent metagenome TaxID=652676 RepID=A0A3B0ZL60_9ZZZZ